MVLTQPAAAGFNPTRSFATLAWLARMFLAALALTFGATGALAQAPVAQDSNVTVGYNSVDNAIVLDITGGAPTLTSFVIPAAHGTATISGLTVLYTPAIGYSGWDSFMFVANNAYGSSSALVSITVSPPAPPIANAVSATVVHDTTNNPITLAITGGLPSSVAIASAASHGTVTASGTSITYTPTAGYAGPDSFAYTATNAGGTSTPAAVSITVSPPAPPIANNMNVTAYMGVTNVITLDITGGAPRTRPYGSPRSRAA